MTHVSYYFQHTEQRKLDRVVQHPLFDKLIQYFVDHQDQEIILRELKRVFSNEQHSEKHFEQFLEDVIRFDLIRREERRYFLNFPLFQAADLQNVHKDQALKLKEHLQDLSELQRIHCYGDTLWDALFSTEGDYFYGIVSEDPLFFERHQAGNDQLTFVSVYPKGATPFNLAAYFTVMADTSGDNLPQIYQPLQRLIGDVDSVYFATQAYRMVRAVRKNRRIADKRNIFLESLLLTKDVTRTEEGYAFLTPVLTEDDTQHITQTLNLEEFLRPFQQMNDRNQRVLSKQLFYQSCLNIFLGDSLELTYFIYR
mgnify:CR=1 FL=1